MELHNVTVDVTKSTPVPIGLMSNKYLAQKLIIHHVKTLKKYVSTSLRKNNFETLMRWNKKNYLLGNY